MTDDKRTANALRPRIRAGFTLFEVVLAIALSALLVALICAAIHVYLFSTDANRTEVEQTQLARSILQKIASDLRGAVLYQPQDTSTATELAESSAAFDVDSLDDPPEPESAPANEDIAGTTAPTMVLGIYGNATEMQVDVSRIPRFDEMESLFAGENNNPVDRPSDIKTVAYYLRTGETVAGSSVMATRIRDDRRNVAGLVRRQIDRATAAWAAENADTAMLDQLGELLAPEVTGLEFAYFDGLEWSPEWDASEVGALPVAVNVRVRLRADDTDEDPPSSVLAYTSQPDTNDVVFEMLVHLPNANASSSSVATDTTDSTGASDETE